jgi:hypothetical protein
LLKGFIFGTKLELVIFLHSNEVAQVLVVLGLLHLQLVRDEVYPLVEACLELVILRILV